ncbi:nitroreductase family protein [Consotaella salsifontis]|nr:nitroreductase [Consotaella salsifontis]
MLDVLSRRRSVPLPMMGEPGPTQEQLDQMLAIAARVPDHGKLAPWRFILYRGAAATGIGEALAALVEAREGDSMTETRRMVEQNRFTRSPLVIGVISTAKPHVKIPEWEQVMSGAAAAMNLIDAAYAFGYGANWVTEWVAYDDEAKAILGIAPDERVIGFIHIGTAKEVIEDRRRPVMADIVTEASAPMV